MNSKTFAVSLFSLLIGSTLCVIPEGEIQIGPVFDPHVASRFFGNKYFEAFFDKGSHGGINKPLLAKKVLLGVGAVGAAGLAAGGAALLAKKFHKEQGHSYSGGYAPGASYGGGWGGSGGYSQSHGSGFNFPSSSGSDYQYQQYGSGQDYSSGPQVDYSQAFASAQSQGGYNSYPAQSSYNYGGQDDYSYSGWSR